MPVTGSPLAHLRLAFVALGCALLLALGLLLHSALSRLDAQRRLRHRMVAERVFDEAEREIGSLLELEAQRPAAAYDASDSNPQRWSPFVVAYYRRDPELQLISDALLDAERRSRAQAAIAKVQALLDESRPKAADADTAGANGHGADGDGAAQRSSPDVLRQLNRSVKVRERRQRKLTESFVVLAADSHTLVVERRSPGGERREGFVVDVPALVSTIQSWVLTAQGLGAVAALSTDLRPGADAKAYHFVHRLAAPLDSQQVALRLSRLDDDDASSALYGLAALLIAAVVLGLFALYRMVAVQVRFAERRNNFVSAVSHELKTPLTAIRMYGEMLRDGMVEDEATRHEYYATITAEGERLSRLVENVMEHAKLRRGTRPTQLVAADPGEVVREVVELMAPHVAQRGFQVTLRVDAGLPRMRVDVDAFKQVLFNVLDNALKYGRGAAPHRLEISCSRAETAIVVSVRDFGPGIVEAQLETVFEPFFRGEDELTRSQQGTGIGLALVRDLVELMHGDVRGINRDPGLEIRIALTAA